MNETTLVMSTLSKTWIFDLDGTLVFHNAYKTGEDKWLPGAKELLQSISEDDYILILTAREIEAKEQTERFLKESRIRYNNILYQMPMGERILFNDNKISGLRMAHIVECNRNEGLRKVKIIINPEL